MELSLSALLISFFLAFVATSVGWVMLRQGQRSNKTFGLMFAAFVAQCAFLYFRGEDRGKCPLGDWGEILVFIAWSLSIFYILIGSAYRVSLLGFFSAPLVTLLCGIALIPGVLEASPEKVTSESIDVWAELHAALSVLSYGALALGMVASVMFLALDKKLKGKSLKGGLFDNLPPVSTLTLLSKRLTFVGLCILTIGILSSFKMVNFASNSPHLITAVVIWLCYLLFLCWSHFKGMTPRAFAKLCIFLFVSSLIPFALI